MHHPSRALSFRRISAAAAPLLVTAVCTAQHLPQAQPTDDVPTRNASAWTSSRPAGDPISVDRESFGLQSLGAELHAEGATYHAVFGPGGPRFTPALGRAAPTDRPVRFGLESIRRGEHLVHDALDHPTPNARFVAGPDAAIYPRGDVLERYEARRDGIEQSFLFPTEPAGQGDLVVRFRIDTSLGVPESSASPTLSFDEPGIGGVTIGEVTGIAADGARAPGWMNSGEGWLELVLPDAFVSRAAYPMVLDPLIFTWQNAGASTNDDRRPDVAYDASTDRYLITWTRIFSSTNVVVRGKVMDGATHALIGPPWVAITDQGGPLESSPAVANINFTNGCVVVWEQQDTPGSSDWNIMGRHVEMNTYTLGPITTIAATSADERNPDVGGEATLSNNDVSVVYEQVGGGIHYVQVDYSWTSYVGIPGARLAITTDANARDAAISKSGGIRRKYFVTWDANGPYIGGCFINYDSTRWTGNGYVAGTDPRRPDVDGDGEQFMLVYDDLEAGSSSSRDVWCIVALASSQRTGPWAYRGGSKRNVTNQANDDEFAPAAGYPGDLAVAAWGDQRGGSQYTMVGNNLAMTGALCGLPFETGNLTGWANTSPSFAAKRSGGVDDHDGALVWDAADLASGSHDVLVQPYQAWNGGSVRVVAPGCGPGGNLTTSGPLAFGNPDFGIHLRGAQPQVTLGALNLDLGPNWFDCSGCQLAAPTVSFTLPITGGAADVTIPVACDPRTIGFTMDAQVVTVINSGGSCPLVRTVAWTEIVRMTVGS